MHGGKRKVKNLYIVSNIVISDFEKAIIDLGIEYQMIKKGAPRFRTYIITNASSEILLNAMPEQWSKGRVPVISYEESRDYKRTTSKEMEYNTCFLQIDVSDCQYILDDYIEK